MNNQTTYKSVDNAWSRDLDADDMLAMLRERVDAVASENAQHRAATRANAQLEAANNMRADARQQLLAYGVDLDAVPERVMGQFSMQLHSLVTGRLLGLGVSDLARQLKVASDAAIAVQEQQKAKAYTVNATKRKDSVGALHVSFDRRPPAYQHVKLSDYAGVATKTMTGFDSDADAINTLANPVNAEPLFGLTQQAEQPLPTLLECLDELCVEPTSPALEDYVLVIVADPKLKNIDACITAPMLDLPRLTTRDLPQQFTRREAQAVFYVRGSIPSARIARALAEQITTTRKLPKGARTTTSLSKVSEEL